MNFLREVFRVYVWGKTSLLEKMIISTWDFFFITISNSVLIFSAFINRCSYSSVHSYSKFSQFAKLKLVKSLYDSVLRPNCEHLMVFPFHAIFCFSIFVLLYICIYFFNIKHICVVNSIALCSYDFRNKDWMQRNTGTKFRNSSGYFVRLLNVIFTIWD